MHSIGNTGRLKLGNIKAESISAWTPSQINQSPLISYPAQLISTLSSVKKQLGFCKTPDAYIPSLNEELQEGIQSILSSAFP